MLVNQEFLMRLLNSSDFFGPPRPLHPSHRPVVTSIEKQYQQQKKKKPHQTKPNSTRRRPMTTATVALLRVAANAPAAAHAWTTVLRPFLPLPLARARAGGRPGGRPPSPGSASTVLVSAPGGVCAIAPVEEPGLGSRPRVVTRTGPANRRKGNPRPPASSLPKEKGKKGEGGSTWKFLGVFHVLVCVHNKVFF